MVVVVLCLCAWGILGVMAFSIFVMNFEGRTHTGYEMWLYALGLGAFAVFVLGLVAIIARARWQWLTAAAAIVVLGLLFLAHDGEPPLPADLGVRVGADDPGYQTIMWLSEKSPYSRLKEAGALEWTDRDFYWPSDSAVWAEHVARNREKIFKAWEKDRIGREWVQAINAQPPKGVWSVGLSAPVLDFKAFRSVLGVRLARSYMLAQDGQQTEALECVAELMRALYVIERTNSGLLHSMIATIALKQCYAVTGAIVALGPISDADRQKLLITLKNAPAAREVIRRAILGEQDFIHDVIETQRYKHGSGISEIKGGRWVELAMRWGGRWVFLNRNDSERQLVWKLNRVAELAEARDVEKLKATAGEWNYGSPFKNPAGRLLSFMMMPSYLNTVENHWKTEDQRLALIARLEGR
jgi:hypothetical protein